MIYFDSLLISAFEYPQHFDPVSRTKYTFFLFVDLALALQLKYNI